MQTMQPLNPADVMRQAPGSALRRGATPMDPPVIFVVDDDASVRTAIRRLLLSLQLPVRLFASAEQFLAGVERGTPGCLILDLHLPGMNGLQLQETLAAQGWGLPIIIVTAHDDDAAKETALRMGALAFLRKPFDRKQFLASVHAAVGQHES
jgi:FixJ family two-component response regulator